VWKLSSTVRRVRVAQPHGEEGWGGLDPVMRRVGVAWTQQ